MPLPYSQLVQLFKNHPALRLLRAENAPLILSFLDKVFIQPNVRSISEADLLSKLEDFIYFLNRKEGEEAYTRPATGYVNDWIQNEKGWLRKFYPPDSDEPHFDLTPATEKALTWIDSLTAQKFVGTESRLLTIFSLLNQMVLGTEVNAETRIAELEKQKQEIEREIAAIKRGEISVMEEVALKDRFMQFTSMAKELLSDFREVEHNFRLLDMSVREKIATWDGSKGELLGQIFGDRDMITDSDQGRSFRAFWDFLMSSKSQEQFSELLEKIFSMEAISSLTPEKRLRKIHFDWLEAGEHTQRTVAGLSEQLRRYLDNQVYLENKRIMEILDNVRVKALSVKENMPQGNFMTMDEAAPEITLPMDRPLYSNPLRVELNSERVISGDENIDYGALFNQVHIDRDELKTYIRRELQLKDQVLLSDVIALHPLRQGLAELVVYISIAGESRVNIFDDQNPETISWVNEHGVEKQARIPRIIINRSVNR